MERANGQESIRTCIVAENCFARYYLMELLRKDPGLKPITLDDLVASRWTLNAPRVFVLDRCGLTIPVCECFRDRKSTRLNSSHQIISYAVFCLKKKKSTRTK